MPARWCGTRSEPALGHSTADCGGDSRTERTIAERRRTGCACGDGRDLHVYRGAWNQGVPGSSSSNLGNQWTPETKRKLRQREKEE